MEEIDGRPSVTSNNSQTWNIFNRKFPKEEIVFFTQVLLIYFVVITCIVNLAIDRGNNLVWSNLLSACVGYMIPSPNIKKDKNTVYRQL